jgi:hypothetical protein
MANESYSDYYRFYKETLHNFQRVDVVRVVVHINTSQSCDVVRIYAQSRVKISCPEIPFKVQSCVGVWGLRYLRLELIL